MAAFFLLAAVVAARRVNPAVALAARAHEFRLLTAPVFLLTLFIFFPLIAAV
jgi:hypothetical protein